MAGLVQEFGVSRIVFGKAVDLGWDDRGQQADAFGFDFEPFTGRGDLIAQDRVAVEHYQVVFAILVVLLYESVSGRIIPGKTCDSHTH